uniref:Uncharacterized protein n=1 Tax=Cacopsylla melanoneura TaxID=428564 RepID=A0A8D8TKZ0_9HEMI
MRVLHYGSKDSLLNKGLVFDSIRLCTLKWLIKFVLPPPLPSFSLSFSLLSSLTSPFSPPLPSSSLSFSLPPLLPLFSPSMPSSSLSFSLLPPSCPLSLPLCPVFYPPFSLPPSLSQAVSLSFVFREEKPHKVIMEIN